MTLLIFIAGRQCMAIDYQEWQIERLAYALAVNWSNLSWRGRLTLFVKTADGLHHLIGGCRRSEKRIYFTA